MNSISNSQRYLGALWGSLTGDALGVPVEFLTRGDIAINPVCGMRGFGTHNQPKGTWSDDSSLLLCTAESLAICGEFNTADMGSRFDRWETQGHWTPHGNVFDVGVTTSQALSRIAAGIPPEECGGADVYSNGNGSLMRILPVALWTSNLSPETLIDYAQRASNLTHRHPRSQMACVLYCLISSKLLDGATKEDALHAALKTFAQTYEEPPYLTERLQFQLLESGRAGSLNEREIQSSGYVIHTLIASVWCLLTSHSFEETVLKAVNLGGDTDTTGTVAGGLAGAFYGLDAIPTDWKNALARHDDVKMLFEQFLSKIPKLSATAIS